MTITEELQTTLTTKNNLKQIMADEGMTVPSLFSDYPTTFESYISNMKELYSHIDFIKVSSDTTLEQLDYLFSILPEFENTTGDIVKVITSGNLNVRCGPSTSYAIIGKVKNGDLAELISTDSATGWREIRKYRYDSEIVSSGTTSTEITAGSTGTVNNTSGTYAYVRAKASSTSTGLGILANGTSVTILEVLDGWYKIEHNNSAGYGYISANEVTVSGTTTTTTELGTLRNYSVTGWVSNGTSNTSLITGEIKPKKIDISACSESIQKSCQASLAESKGWEVIYGYINTTQGSTSGTVATTTQTATFDFSSYSTNVYTTSSFTTLKEQNPRTYARQGYYSSAGYNKGFIKFSSSTLASLQNILSKAKEIESMVLYLQRDSDNHGYAEDSTVCLRAAGGSTTTAITIPTGNTGRLLDRGETLTLDLTTISGIVDGFKNSTYNHFQVWVDSSVDQSSGKYYIKYKNNAKIVLTYTI